MIAKCWPSGGRFRCALDVAAPGYLLIAGSAADGAMEGLSSINIEVGRMSRMPSTTRFLPRSMARGVSILLCWWQRACRIRLLAKSRTIFGGGASGRNDSNSESCPTTVEWLLPRLSVSLADRSPRWLSSACRETVNCQVPANQRPRCRHPPSSFAESMCSHCSQPAASEVTQTKTSPDPSDQCNQPVPHF
jgi:hypothetical protein